MNKISRYIPSLLVSVLMVFVIIGCVGVFVAKSSLTRDNLIKITEENSVSDIVYEQINKYYSEKYYTTAIPADVYMDSINSDTLRFEINENIYNLFSCLDGSPSLEENGHIEELDKSIENFYREYAKNNGYTDEEKLDSKIADAQENADKVIKEQCDVFKARAMISHGITAKAAPFYKKTDTVSSAAAGAFAVLLVLLFLFNTGCKRATLYWLGISSMLAGIFGALPCGYLIKTDYFNSFTIKQPQIFTAYTSVMKSVTSSCFTAFAAILGFGLVCTIVYGILQKKSK